MSQNTNFSKLYKPTNPYSEDIYAVIDGKKEAKKSRVVEWYNENVDPYHNGLNVEREKSEIDPLIDKAFTELPVNLSPLTAFLTQNKCHQFTLSNSFERLIITLLNEEDNRISSVLTKNQILRIFEQSIKLKRIVKVRLRMAFQAVKERWIDEIYEADTDEMREQYQRIILDLKRLLIKCWRITDDVANELLVDQVQELSIEQTKQIVIRHYAAIQFQSIVRGFLDRRHLAKALEASKEEQQNEIKKWSIVIIQKVVRGFIARQTIIRSMKIRKKLPKELLQIAEKYLIVPKDPNKDDRRVGEEEYDRELRHQKEKFQHPDLWGFLSEINQELLHFKREIYENELREDVYANKFVEKVIAYRQNQFEGIWDKFPKAIQDFTKDTNNTHLIGSLLPMKKDELVTLHYGELHPKEDPKHPRQTIHKISQMFETKQLQTSMSPIKQLLTASSEPSLIEGFPSITSTIDSAGYPMPNSNGKPTLNTQSSAHSFQSFQSPSKASAAAATNISSMKKSKKMMNKKEITVTDVASAMTKNSQESLANQLLQAQGGEDPDGIQALRRQQQSLAPSELISGPLVRKALQVTVQQEVSQQLNQLMNHNFHSRRLTNDIISAYEKDSVYVKGEATQKLLAGGFKKKSVNKGGGGGNGQGGKLQPINLDEIKKQQRAQKKKTGQKGVDGRIKEFKGKIEATHNDWITDTTKNFRVKDPSSPRHITEEVLEGKTAAELRHQKPPQQHPTVHAGEALLIDVPNGLNDSIERLVHAAAIRCYVPDFFRGPRTEAAYNDNYSSSEESSIAEVDDDSMVSSKRLRKKRRQQEKNPNHDPNYAYQIYLQMPMGLAKVKYELDCQKWSQGVINKLRVKGLNFLHEVSPVSKFIICLRNVEAPKILIEKCADLYLELKKMGNLPKGIKLPSDAVDKKMMEVGLPPPRSPHSPAHSSTSPTTPKKSALRLSNKDLLSPQRTAASSISVTEGDISHQQSFAATDQSGGFTGDEDNQPNDESDQPERGLQRKASSKKISFDDSCLLAPDNSIKEEEVENNEDVEEVKEESELTLQDIPSFIKRPYGLSKQDLSLLEEASKLLQEVLENTEQAEWCNLTANIEELFIQAAFLIIPHTSKRFPHYNDLLRHHLEHSPDEDIKIKTFYVNEEEDDTAGVGEDETEMKMKMKKKQYDDEEIMGNYAFKLYMMELLQIHNEEEKVELIKTRFRASVIFTSPFTLYLKSKGITSIKQLLTIDLKDLQLPKPLFIQVEIMINIIISSKIVKATLLSVPRDLQNLEKGAFYTPMFYDQKFQRTPLDPYGRPIGLGITQVKERLKQQDYQQEKKRKQRKNELNPLIEEDLVKEVSIWEKNDHLKPKVNGEDEEVENGLGELSESSYMSETKQKAKMLGGSNKNNKKMDLFKKDENHQFDFMMNQMDEQQLSEVKQLLPEVVRGAKSLVRSVETAPGQVSNRNSIVGTADQPNRSQTATSAINTDIPPSSSIPTKKKKARRGIEDPTRSGSVTLPASTTSKQQTKKLPVFTPSPQLRHDWQNFKQANDFTLSTHPLIDPTINTSIFTNTYICHYPHCGQIFSRLYTYKVHLRTHENFPEYFQYKRQPQLSYDNYH